MKNILFLLALLCAGNFSYAQWTSGSGYIYNTAFGNVGIGTNSPQAKLEVNNNSYSDDNQLILSGAEYGRYYGVIGEFVASGQTVLTFGTKSNFTNYFRTLNLINGNVGIGTTNPYQRLDLNGGNITLGNINNSGVITFRNDIPIGTAGSVGISAIDAAGNGNSDGLGLHISDGLKILSGQNTYFTLLSNTGNVGIGTTSPDQKLTVNGTIHSKEVKVDLNVPAPDYVFDIDYKLSSLNATKDYIDKNHHLPEMPSADQLAKDGLNLGEMNLLLLKKVEELTLHLIEKEKQVNDLSNKLTRYDEQQAQLKQQLETLTKEIRKK